MQQTTTGYHGRRSRRNLAKFVLFLCEGKALLLDISVAISIHWSMQWKDRIHRQLSPRDLRVFLAVAEHGNISKAADSLAISRPVISRTIADLERTLGVPLFDRSQQGVEPTLYGRALRELAITVSDDMRQGMQEIEFLANPTAGELR